MEIMKPISKETADHYTWGDHCEGWRLVDRPEISIIQEKMPPGTSEVPHFHEKSLQFFYILAGSAEIILEGERTVLNAGAGIEVAPRCKHLIRNPGPDVLEFILVSRPNTHGDRVEV